MVFDRCVDVLLHLALWVVVVIGAFVVAVVASRLRERRADRWAGDRRSDMRAAWFDGERSGTGRVRIDGDELEWRFRGARCRTPLHVPGTVARSLFSRREVDYDGEFYLRPDGERVWLGVPVEAREALDRVRSAPPRPPGSRNRSARVSPTALGLSLLGVACLLGSALMWFVWVTSVDVTARVVSTHDDSCTVVWSDPGDGSRHDASVDCFDITAGRHYAVGDPIPVKAHTGIFHGEAVGYHGAATFLRFWLPAIGLVLIAAAWWWWWWWWSRRERRVPVEVVRLEPVLRSTTSGVRPADAPASEDRLVALALRSTALQQLPDDGIGGAAAPGEPGWWRSCAQAGGWWLPTLPLLGVALAPDDGVWLGWWVIGAACAALVVVQVVRVVAYRRRAVEHARRPWTAGHEVVGLVLDGSGALLVLDTGVPRWLVPVDGMPPRFGTVELRGELVEGGRVDARRGRDSWPGIAPVEGLDDDERSDLCRWVADELAEVGGG